MPPETELAKQQTVPAALDHLPKPVLRDVSFYLTEKERARLSMVNRSLYRKIKPHIEDLPEEILLHILSFLDLQKTNQVITVNRLLHRVGLDEVFWRGLLEYYFYPEQIGSDNLEPGETWRKRYYQTVKAKVKTLENIYKVTGIMGCLGCVWRKIDSDLSQTPVPKITMRWMRDSLLIPSNLCFFLDDEAAAVWNRDFVNQVCFDQELVSVVQALPTPETNDSSRLTDKQRTLVKKKIRDAIQRAKESFNGRQLQSEFVRPTAEFLLSPDNSFKPAFLKKQFPRFFESFNPDSDFEKFARVLSLIKGKVAREEYVPDELLAFMDELLKTPVFLRKVVQNHKAFKNYFPLLSAEQSQLLLDEFEKSDCVRSFVEEEFGNVFRNRAMIFSQMCYDVIPEDRPTQRLQFQRLILKDVNFKFIVFSPEDLILIWRGFEALQEEIYRVATKRDNFLYIVRDVSDCFKMIFHDFGSTVDKTLMLNAMFEFLNQFYDQTRKLLDPNDPEYAKILFNFFNNSKEINLRVYLDQQETLISFLGLIKAMFPDYNFDGCFQIIEDIQKNLSVICNAEFMELQVDKFNLTVLVQDDSFFDLPDRRALYDARAYCAKNKGCAIDYRVLLDFLYGSAANRLNHLWCLNVSGIRKFRSALLNYVDLIALAGTAYTQNCVIRRFFSSPEGPKHRMLYLMLLQGNNLAFDKRIDGEETYFSIRWKFLLVKNDLPNVFYFVGLSGNIDFIETIIQLYDEMVNRFKKGTSQTYLRDRASVFKSNRDAQAALNDSMLCSENPEAFLWLVKNDLLRLRPRLIDEGDVLYQMACSFREIEKAIRKSVTMVPSSSSKIGIFAKKALNHDENYKIKHCLKHAYELSPEVYGVFMGRFLTHQKHSLLNGCSRDAVLKILLPLPEFQLSRNPEVLRIIATYFTKGEIVKKDESLAQTLIEKAEKIEKDRGDADAEISDNEIEEIRTNFSRMGG